MGRDEGMSIPLPSFEKYSGTRRRYGGTGVAAWFVSLVRAFARVRVLHESVFVRALAHVVTLPNEKLRVCKFIF